MPRLACSPSASLAALPAFLSDAAEDHNGAARLVELVVGAEPVMTMGSLLDQYPVVHRAKPSGSLPLLPGDQPATTLTMIPCNIAYPAYPDVTVHLNESIRRRRKCLMRLCGTSRTASGDWLRPSSNWRKNRETARRSSGRGKLSGKAIRIDK